MKRSCRWAALGFVLAVAWTHVAMAQTRVVVRPFEGQGADAIRDTVVQAVAEGEGLQPVTNKEVGSAASSANADLQTEAGRVAVARTLSISAFVEGKVQRQGSTTQVILRVYDGRDGGLLTDAEIRAPHASIHNQVRSRFLAELGRAIRQGQPPPALDALPPPVSAPQPQPAEPAPPSAKDEPKPIERPAPAQTADVEPENEPEPKRQRSALELGAGLLAMTRNFGYRDALIKLTEHTVAPTPALRIDARWYPGAYSRQGLLANIGLDLNALLMFPADATRNNTGFGTSSSEFGIAARARFPVSEHELGLVAGYGGHSFAIDNADGKDPGLPSVAYQFVRLGADGRIAVNKTFFVQGRLAYLALTGYGELGRQAWFSHVSGGGLDGELTLGFDVSELVTLTAAGGATRFFMSLNPKPNDASVDQGRIAGGAHDQYAYGLLGIRLRPY